MAQSYEFYIERAEEAEKAANNAQLARVKERELRAAGTWRGLAKQAQQVAVERQKADAARAAKREAEAEALAAE